MTTMNDATHKCIVVGGGITGLSCAFDLARRGYQPVLLEADSIVGGLLASYDFDSFRIEKYYHLRFFSFITSQQNPAKGQVW